MSKKVILVLIVLSFFIGCSEEVFFPAFDDGLINTPISSEVEKSYISINLSDLIPQSQIQPSYQSRSIINDNLKGEINYFQVFIYNDYYFYENSLDLTATADPIFIESNLTTSVVVGPYKIILLAGYKKNSDLNTVAYLASGVMDTFFVYKEGNTINQFKVYPIKMNLAVPNEQEQWKNFSLNLTFETRNVEILAPTSVNFNSKGYHVFPNGEPFFMFNREESLTCEEPGDNITLSTTLQAYPFCNYEDFKLVGSENYFSFKDGKYNYLLDGSTYDTAWVLPTYETVEPNKFEDVLKQGTYVTTFGNINIKPVWGE